MTEKRPQNRFLEILNGRSTSYAMLYVMCTLCLARLFLYGPDLVFASLMLSVLAVILFTIGWNIFRIVRRLPVAQAKSRWDSFFDLATLVLFICFSIASIIGGELFFSILGVAALVLLATAFLYLAFRNG